MARLGGHCACNASGHADRISTAAAHRLMRTQVVNANE